MRSRTPRARPRGDPLGLTPPQRRPRSADPAGDGLVWFAYQPSKSPAHPRAVLRDYRGVPQTDGAAGLDALGVPNAVVHLGGWAHARRRFIRALRLGESRAGPYVAQFDRRFRLDARARRITAAYPDHAARVATWRARLRCITAPRARLDNNAVENAIRPLKLGAKHWLVVGHPDAGPRLANLFTRVENARQAGIDVEAYLTALRAQLPDHSVRRLGEWLPRAWQRRAHAAQQAPGALGLTASPDTRLGAADYATALTASTRPRRTRTVRPARPLTS